MQSDVVEAFALSAVANEWRGASPSGVRQSPAMARWTNVRCWWRLRPSAKGPYLLRQLTGTVSASWLEGLRRSASDAYLGEIRVECLTSGRTAFVAVRCLDQWTGSVPPRDRSSVWATQDRRCRHRGKFLSDLDAICRRAVRRRVIDRFALSFFLECADRVSRDPDERGDGGGH